MFDPFLSLNRISHSYLLFHGLKESLESADSFLTRFPLELKPVDVIFFLHYQRSIIFTIIYIYGRLFTKEVK